MAAAGTRTGTTTRRTAEAGDEPLEGKGERTRRRLLAAAIDHFAEAGLDGASMPEIARRVGVSHSAVYQHFGRKEALFRTAVDADLSGVFAAVTPPLGAPSPGPDELVGLIRTLVGATRQHPLARRVLANLDPEQVDALRDLPALADLQVALAGAVARGQSAGTLRADLPADLVADGLITVALGLVCLALRVDGLHDIPRARNGQRFLIEMLRPPI